ncbi:MAG: 7-cyano-7-deazaguanine synthase QueC [Marine Group III euryarchaeote CG-Bathy2]|uniref:7-cyano-7-deazaguanine synthase n=2 Tax=Methanobacteriati TaxID=3366610 RepID=A0A075GPZ4_9EURY|nr:aluminum resistance protein (queC) [uncultured marine group II/III euryarchaeote KM3_188_A01]OIR09612.1 MAG: 7-cyano-7-deazaguanine synthase QueC [Marine Group III euryarchaeote CG-Bathy2]
MGKALVVFSGGQDSTTCLYWALARHESVAALTFDYGQRHRVEIDAAREIAALAGVDWELVELPGLAGSSPLTDASRTVAQYGDAEPMPNGVEATFVPGRNLLFLAVAANRAAAAGCDTIVAGVCETDFGGYPDCRQPFINAMQAAINAAIEGAAPAIAIETPLMQLTKRETVLLAQEVGALPALALSHTCYNGARPPCGSCHACLLRRRGFEAAGIPDPLEG